MPGADRTFGGLDQLLAGLVHGDLQLRRDSLRAPGLLPTLLVATGVRTQLRFMAETREQGRFLWAQKTDTRPVAEVRLELRLAKQRKPAPAAAAPAGAELDAPDFLACLAPDADTLRLVLPDGNPLDLVLRDGTLRLPGASRDLAVASVAGRSAWDDGPQDYAGDYLTGWPVAVLVRTVNTLAHWRRRGEPRALRPFRFPPDRDALSRVLGQARDTWREVGEVLDGDPPDPDGRLARLKEELEEADPQLAGALVLDEARLSLTLYVNDHGELAGSGSNLYRQRLDLDAELVPHAEGPRLRLALGLSDVLVGGELHQRFLRGLRSDDAAKRIARALLRPPAVLTETPAAEEEDEPPELSAGQVADWLRSPLHDSTAVFVRMRHDDTDLVLLQPAGSQRSGMMWQVPFAQDGTLAAHAPRPGNLKLLAWHSDTRGWLPGTGENLAPRYFYRLYRTLHTWQSGMRQEVPS